MAGWTLMEPPDGWAHLAITRRLETGNVDQAFGEHGRMVIENRAAQKFVHDSETLRVHADGTLLVSANYVNPDNLDPITSVVFRYQSNGQPHLLFNEGKPLQTQYDSELMNRWKCGYSQPDGSIVTVSGTYPVYIARFQSNGVPDSDFGNAGHIDLEARIITDPAQLLCRTGTRCANPTQLNVGLTSTSTHNFPGCPGRKCRKKYPPHAKYPIATVLRMGALRTPSYQAV